MSEDIVKEVQDSVPEYIDIDQVTDNYENLRITNLIIDSLNNKKASFIEMFITDSAETIPNLPEYGAFIICVQGEQSTMPGRVYACCSNGTAGSVASLVSQAGTTAPSGETNWNGKVLTIAASGANFTVAHDNTGISAKFYLTILGYF